MVVDVEKMSDSELRTKLTEFGMPVMPITGTTRKVMVKKLKLLMDNKRKTSDGRKSLGQFSSEEESDTDISTVKKNKNRRATMGAPLIQPINRSKNVIRKSVRGNDTINNSTDDPSTSKRVVTTTTTRVTKTVQDDFDTGSDSDLEIISKDIELPSKSTNSFDTKRDSPILSSSYNKRTSSSSKYVTPKPLTSPVISSVFVSKKQSPSDYLSSTSTSSTHDNLQQIRSRLSLGASGFDRPLFTSSPRVSNDNTETPYLSNFADRLGQLASARPKFESKNDVIKEHDTNGAGSLGRRWTRYRDVNRDYYSHNNNIVKDNLVSFAVLGVAILFFVAVGIMYYGIRSDGSALDAIDYFVPRCEELGPTSEEGVNCLYDKDVASAIKLMSVIKPELIKTSVAHTCHDSEIKPYATEQDILNFQHKRSKEPIVDLRRHLNHLEILILKNPEWGINVIQCDDSLELSEEDILKSVDEIISKRSTKQIGLAVLNPELPWLCIFYKRLYAILQIGTILSGVCLIIYILNYIFNLYKQYQQRKSEELGSLIDQIIETLQTNSDEDYLIINHVREMIIPFKDRQRMAALWEKAVKFINENDSRVRCETQNVKGELFRVWRWLGSATLNASCSPRSKTWQGQAFETQQGSVNSLPFSPTPCLKIRGMVDDNEENYAAIKEAVLNKCADECRILHCGVDNTSKCVYLKCSDQNDAAVAYRNLHGWWYAGHLVTVKYLRLERYMQRFPESPTTGPPFLHSSLPASD